MSQIGGIGVFMVKLAQKKIKIKKLILKNIFERLEKGVMLISAKISID